MDIKKCVGSGVQITEKDFQNLVRLRTFWKSNVILEEKRKFDIDYTIEDMGEMTDLKYTELKYKCWAIYRNAIKLGELVRQPCKVCKSKENIHGHHTNYYKPLKVVWLCSSHHRKAHRGSKKYLIK